jgi:hypothetical protein
MSAKRGGRTASPTGSQAGTSVVYERSTGINSGAERNTGVLAAAGGDSLDEPFDHVQSLVLNGVWKGFVLPFLTWLMSR